MRAKRRYLLAGFTLLEMAVVLSIIAIMMPAIMAISSTQLENSRISVTMSRLDAIEAAIQTQITNAGYEPCPASTLITLDDANISDDVNFGVSTSCAQQATIPGSHIEDAGTYDLRPAGGSANGSDDIRIGSVPTRTLALPDSMMFDGWGNRFTYMVVKSLSRDKGTATAYMPKATLKTGVLVVQDAAGNQVPDALPTTVIPYVIISHGKSGRGAIPRLGGTLAACASGYLESQNCNLDEIVVDARYNDSVIPANYDTNFIRWKHRMSLWPLPQPPAPYLYAMDQGNNRIQIFSNTGTFISQFPCASGICPAGSNPGDIKGPNIIAVDPIGNVWVSDAYNYRVNKYSASGTYMSVTFGAHGNSSGMRTAITSDAGGNIWVTDTGGTQVQEFDSNGNWLATLCNNYFGPSPPACTAGTGSGYFSGVDGLAFDHLGNLWVADGNNKRLQEFSSSGIYIKSIGPTYTGGTGSFGWPGYIAIDPSNNIWVEDGNSKNIIKFSNAGSYIASYGPGYGQGSYLINPLSLVSDSSGNVWIADFYYADIVEISNTGSLIATFGSLGSGDGQFGSGYNAPALKRP